MADSASSEVVYRGETLITDFDIDDLDRLDAILEDFVDVDEGEELYVSLPLGKRLEVRKLREEEPS